MVNPTNLPGNVGPLGGEARKRGRGRKSTLSHGRRFIIYKNMQGCTLVQQDCCVTQEPDVNSAPCHPPVTVLIMINVSLPFTPHQALPVDFTHTMC